MALCYDLAILRRRNLGYSSKSVERFEANLVNTHKAPSGSRAVRGLKKLKVDK